MKKDRENLPIINLNLGEKFTKNSNKLLRELLQMFLKETPAIRQEINKAFNLKQTQELNDLLHKLHASCVYCGLDRLKESLNEVKGAIRHEHYAKKQLESFNKDIEDVITEANKIVGDSPTKSP
jgi:two-component system, NarL family, sensor histidine kinase BarA